MILFDSSIFQSFISKLIFFTSRKPRTSVFSSHHFLFVEFPFVLFFSFPHNHQESILYSSSSPSSPSPHSSLLLTHVPPAPSVPRRSSSLLLDEAVRKARRRVSYANQRELEGNRRLFRRHYPESGFFEDEEPSSRLRRATSAGGGYTFLSSSSNASTSLAEDEEEQGEGEEDVFQEEEEEEEEEVSSSSNSGKRRRRRDTSARASKVMLRRCLWRGSDSTDSGGSSSYYYSLGTGGARPKSEHILGEVGRIHRLFAAGTSRRPRSSPPAEQPWIPEEEQEGGRRLIAAVRLRAVHSS